jgi:osmotically-inducible protein OsmY
MGNIAASGAKQARSIPLPEHRQRRRHMALRNDQDIVQDVYEEIDFDPAVSMSNLEVTAYDGRVTLRGFAQSYREAWEAARAAQRVRGVRGVTNEIVITSSGETIADDSRLAEAINAAFVLDSTVPRERINVDVAQGVATLSGNVDWRYQADAAERDVRIIPGVRAVVNGLEVTPPYASAEDIHTGIARAFARNAALADDNVAVSVEGGHVLLTGNVRTDGERDEARAIAWRAPGVTDVTDNLYVTD